jgi:hypothetical protein
MIAAHALVHCKPAGAAKPREGADRGPDESLLSEATRDATEAVGVSPRRRATIDQSRNVRARRPHHNPNGTAAGVRARTRTRTRARAEFGIRNEGSQKRGAAMAAPHGYVLASSYLVSSLMAPLKLSMEMRGPPEPVLKLSSLPGVYLLVLVASGPMSLAILPEKVLSS